MNVVQPLAIVTGIILIAAITLAALGTISWRLFWMIAIASAVIAYYVLPKMREAANG